MLDPENLDPKSREMLDFLLKKDNLSVFCKDLNLRFFNCNDAFLNDCGMSAVTPLIGKSDYDLSWTKEEAGFYRLIDKEVIETNKFKLGIVEEQTDHRLRKKWIETCKFPLIGSNGKVVGLIGYYTERS